MIPVTEAQQPDRTAAKSRTRLPPSTEYAALKRIIKAAGLLESDPRYFAFKALSLLLVYAGIVTAIVVFAHPAIILTSAVLLGFTFTQVGLLGHDLAHRQITHNSRAVRWLGLLVGNLLIAVSYSWWTTKHNQHHATPNHLDADPDLQYAVLAFDAKSIGSRPRLFYPIIAYQGILFMLMGTFQAYMLRVQAVRQVLSERSPSRLAEAAALALHGFLYVALLTHVGHWGVALAFVALHHGTFGLYNTLVFAPNHKGMPVIDETSRMDYLREQVLTARNIVGHPLIDFVYGGLNYQIEHHLFPSMARNRLSAAQPIVAQFCAEHDVDYLVAGPLRGIVDPIRHLHAVAAPLRSQS